MPSQHILNGKDKWQIVDLLSKDCLFTDVTLLSNEGEHIPAHRSLLASSSEFFKEIFGHSQRSNSVIYFYGIQHRILILLKEFIYFGLCKVSEEDLDTFLKLGKNMKVVGLKTSNFKKRNPDSPVSKLANFKVDKEEDEFTFDQLSKQHSEVNNDIPNDNYNIIESTDNIISENNLSVSKKTENKVIENSKSDTIKNLTYFDAPKNIDSILEENVSIGGDIYPYVDIPGNFYKVKNSLKCHACEYSNKDKYK